MDIAYAINSWGERIYIGRDYSAYDMDTNDIMLHGTVVSFKYTYTNGIVRVFAKIKKTWVNINAIHGEWEKAV